MRIEISGGIDGTLTSGRNYTVKVNGEDITRYVRTIKVDVDMEGMPHATLEVFPSAIEIDAEVRDALCIPVPE